MLPLALGALRSPLIYPANRNWTAVMYTVLQIGSSFLMSLVRGRNFLGDVWRPIVPTSGLEEGVAKSFSEVRTRM